MSDRSFPFSPRSTATLEVGDLIAVPREPSGWACLQVADLNRRGPGARTTFVAGVLRWRGEGWPCSMSPRRTSCWGTVRPASGRWVTPRISSPRARQPAQRPDRRMAPFTIRLRAGSGTSGSRDRSVTWDEEGSLTIVRAATLDVFLVRVVGAEVSTGQTLTGLDRWRSGRAGGT